MEAYVRELARRVRETLGDRFVGAWLVGSAALDDYDPRRSDVDFHASFDPALEPAFWCTIDVAIARRRAGGARCRPPRARVTDYVSGCSSSASPYSASVCSLVEVAGVAHDPRRRVLVAVRRVVDQVLFGELESLGLAAPGLLDGAALLEPARGEVERAVVVVEGHGNSLLGGGADRQRRFEPDHGMRDRRVRVPGAP